MIGLKFCITMSGQGKELPAFHYSPKYCGFYKSRDRSRHAHTNGTICKTHDNGNTTESLKLIVRHYKCTVIR
jgi:hypothetical protein